MRTTTTAVIDTDRWGNTAITIQDVRLRLVKRDHDDLNFSRKSRVYGAVDALGGELAAALDANVDAGYGTLTDQERVQNDHEYRSLKRRTTAHVRAQLTRVFEIFAAAVPEFDDLTAEGASFSAKAGCACRCSPGFVLAGTVRYVNHPVDVHVDHIQIETENTEPEAYDGQAR